MNRDGLKALMIIALATVFAAFVVALPKAWRTNAAGIQQEVYRREADAQAIMKTTPLRTHVQITTKDCFMANYIAMLKPRQPVEVEVSFYNDADESLNNLILALDDVRDYTYKKGSATLWRSSISSEESCTLMTIKDDNTKSLKLALDTIEPDELISLRLTLIPKTRFNENSEFMDRLVFHVYNVADENQIRQKFYLVRQNSFWKRLAACMLPAWIVGMISALTAEGLILLVFRSNTAHGESKSKKTDEQQPDNSIRPGQRVRSATPAVYPRDQSAANNYGVDRRTATRRSTYARR